MVLNNSAVVNHSELFLLSSSYRIYTRSTVCMLETFLNDFHDIRWAYMTLPVKITKSTSVPKCFFGSESSEQYCHFPLRLSSARGLASSVSIYFSPLLTLDEIINLLVDFVRTWRLRGAVYSSPSWHPLDQDWLNLEVYFCAWPITNSLTLFDRSLIHF